MSTITPDSSYSDIKKVLQPRLLAFFNELQALSLESSDKMLVPLLGMGGTFQSQTTKDGGLSPKGSLPETLGILGVKAPQNMRVLPFEVMNLDSSQLHVHHWRVLAEIMLEMYAKIPKIVKKDVPLGFIVTHGTDTMAYGSAFLWHMLGDGVPFSVIFTGAQTPVHYGYSDARLNLENAYLALKMAQNQKIRRVMLLCGSQLLPGNLAGKVHDTSANAFLAHNGVFYIDFSEKVRKDSLLFHEMAKKKTEMFRPFTDIDNKYANTPVCEINTVSPEKFTASLLPWTTFITPLFGASTCPLKKAEVMISAFKNGKVPILKAAFPENTTRMGTYTAGSVLKDYSIPFLNTSVANIQAFSLIIKAKLGLQTKKDAIWGEVFETKEMQQVFVERIRDL